MSGEIKCPCHNCITLAICKGVMDKHNGLWVYLSLKCSLFEEYQHMYLDEAEVLFLAKLFNRPK